MARTFDAARRSALVAQTLELLRQRRVGRLTMSELATALGVKRPTLYFYFRDLSGLLLAAVEDLYRAYAVHIAGRLAPIEHPVEALGELARATVEYQRERRDLVILLFQLWAAGDTDPELLLARSRAAGQVLRVDLVARLRAGVERGVVTPCDPERVVDLVLTVLDGTIVAAVTGSGAPAVAIDELWRQVLAPMIVQPPTRKRPRKATRGSA